MTTHGQDWQDWHAAYDDPSSGLTRRLALVQEQVGAFLDATAPRPVRVVSLCAGDGRDLLGVLEGRDDAERVTATLVELDPGLAAAATARAATSRAQVEVRCADAGTLAPYAGCLPADLVLLCGVLGNVTDDDARHAVEAMGHFCAEGGRVVWTRHHREPDLTLAVRKWFSDNGFEEVAFLTWEGSLASVGVHERVAPRVEDPPTEPLFTFV